MNTGTVSFRYASALMKFVSETGNGELVYGQVMRINGSLSSIPQLREVIDNPMSVPDAVKFELLESALDGEEMEPQDQVPEMDVPFLHHALP